jgi:aerobic-type carbon monoxide dehydrogenase small subunit (CoxS/CutS family)
MPNFAGLAFVVPASAFRCCAGIEQRLGITIEFCWYGNSWHSRTGLPSLRTHRSSVPAPRRAGHDAMLPGALDARYRLDSPDPSACGIRDKRSRHCGAHREPLDVGDRRPTGVASPAMELRVNGQHCEVEVDPDTPLLWVLRDELGLTGTKYGCGLEQCGACAVVCDGRAVLSCATPVEAFVGRELRTIEGIAGNGVLHALQHAFVAEQAAQCGYCVPGILVALVALFERGEPGASAPRGIERTRAPDDAEVRAALAGHLCRCGAHPRMLRAVRRAMRELGSP